MSGARPQIAVNTEAEAMVARAKVRTAPRLYRGNEEPANGRFVERDGLIFAGRHLIIDVWSKRGLDDSALIERALIDAVEAAGATLLHLHLHRFSPSGGISGVALLAESHISVHTWPERGYAALDVFMCGDADPARTVPVFRAAFAPERMIVSEYKRGII